LPTDVSSGWQAVRRLSTLLCPPLDCSGELGMGSHASRSAVHAKRRRWKLRLASHPSRIGGGE
jgi:hypothetical protein